MVLRVEGMCVASRASLTGENGITIKYASALHVRRKLWIPDAFTDKHAQVADCINNCVAVGPCSWPVWEQAPCRWDVVYIAHCSGVRVVEVA